jgi:hypothetical protein
MLGRDDHARPAGLTNKWAMTNPMRRNRQPRRFHGQLAEHAEVPGKRLWLFEASPWMLHR